VARSDAHTGASVLQNCAKWANTSARLQQFFRHPLPSWRAPGSGLSAPSLATGKSAELAREEIARAAAAGVTLLLLEDALYPRRLKATYDPPLVGYVRGDLEFVIEPGIAAVGTRHRTPYGSGMAERHATDLAAQWFVIISGMAAASTARAIAAQSLPKASRSRCLAPGLT